MSVGLSSKFNSRRNLAKILNTLKDELYKRKRMSVAEASVLLGYSLEYFRRSILPQLLAMTSCLQANRELVWVCNEEKGEGE